jgi:hypothetical protein
MKRLSAHLAVLLAATLALGCSRRPEGFIPLATGLTRTYDIEYSNVLGGVQHGEAVVRVEEKKTIGQHEYFRVVTAIKGIPGRQPEVAYQRLAADGLHKLRYDGDRPVDYLDVPWPLKVGQAWLVDAAGLEMSCRVDGRAAAVLPEKTYDDTYKISCYGTRDGLQFKNQSYLAEGVGTVRTVLDLGSIAMEMRLREVR